MKDRNRIYQFLAEKHESTVDSRWDAVKFNSINLWHDLMYLVIGRNSNKFTRDELEIFVNEHQMWYHNMCAAKTRGDFYRLLGDLQKMYREAKRIIER